MKSITIALALLLITFPVLDGLACSGSPTSTIPITCISEIYAISDDPLIGKYIEIKKVEDEGYYLYISINLIYDPEIMIDLEDTFKQADMWTHAVAESSVKILTRYNISKDISVWAHLPLGEGQVARLGATRYNSKTGSYLWERYKP